MIVWLLKTSFPLGFPFHCLLLGILYWGINNKILQLKLFQLMLRSYNIVDIQQHKMKLKSASVELFKRHCILITYQVGCNPESKDITDHIFGTKMASFYLLHVWIEIHMFFFTVTYSVRLSENIIFSIVYVQKMTKAKACTGHSTK